MELQLKNPALGRFIDEQVRSGKFPTPEAVVEDALTRMIEEKISLTDEDVAAIKAADEQTDRGEYVEFREFASQMRRKFDIR